MERKNIKSIYNMEIVLRGMMKEILQFMFY